MNEQEMTNLLDRATRDLAPDVETLVAGGLRRGRVKQRRRRVAGVVASTVVVLLTVGVGSQLLDAVNVGSRAIDPADPVPPAVSPSVPRPPTPTTPSPSSAPTKAKLAVTAEQVPAAFAALHPGEVSVPSATGLDRAPTVDFTWNGFGIRVGLAPDDWVTFRSVPGGTEVRSVSVYRPDGWDVVVMAYNGPGKEGPATADEPPFTLRELRRIALSDIWFR